MLNIRRGIGRVGVVSLVLWELITLSGGSKTTTAHFLMPSPLDCGLYGCRPSAHRVDLLARAALDRTRLRDRKSPINPLVIVEAWRYASAVSCSSRSASFW